MLVHLLNYPDHNLLKKLWAHGGAREIESQLRTSWFSSVELNIGGVEVLRFAVKARYLEDLAIPVGEFWNDWTSLLHALKHAQLAETKFWPSENIEDSLRFRGEKVDYEGTNLVVSVVDQKINRVLSIAHSSYAELVSQTQESWTTIANNFTSLIKELGLPIDQEPIDFSHVLERPVFSKE